MTTAVIRGRPSSKSTYDNLLRIHNEIQERTTCECGKTISLNRLEKHTHSKLHQRFMDFKVKFPNVKIEIGQEEIRRQEISRQEEFKKKEDEDKKKEERKKILEKIKALYSTLSALGPPTDMVNQ